MRPEWTSLHASNVAQHVISLTHMIAEDGVGVIGRQLRVVERSSRLFAHVQKSFIVRREERVLDAGALQRQLIPRVSAFHKLPYLQLQLYRPTDDTQKCGLSCP